MARLDARTQIGAVPDSVGGSPQEVRNDSARFLNTLGNCHWAAARRASEMTFEGGVVRLPARQYAIGTNAEEFKELTSAKSWRLRCHNE